MQQAVPQAAATGGAGSTLTVLLLLAGLLVIVAIGVKLYDLKRKRDAEGVHLQAQVSDALLRDQSLFGLAVTPTATVPWWSGTPARLEATGHVPISAPSSSNRVASATPPSPTARRSAGVPILPRPTWPLASRSSAPGISPPPRPRCARRCDSGPATRSPARTSRWYSGGYGARRKPRRSRARRSPAAHASRRCSWRWPARSS